jgi:hypothetical protein
LQIIEQWSNNLLLIVQKIYSRKSCFCPSDDTYVTERAELYLSVPYPPLARLVRRMPGEVSPCMRRADSVTEVDKGLPALNLNL